jgi:hypothetical protein
MLYLVRHGHAGNKRTWNGPDPQRPLSPNGAARERRAHRPAPCRTDRQDSVQSGPALPTDCPAPGRATPPSGGAGPAAGGGGRPGAGHRDGVQPCTGGRCAVLPRGADRAAASGCCVSAAPRSARTRSGSKGRPGPCRSTATPYPLQPTCRHRVARFPDPDAQPPQRARSGRDGPRDQGQAPLHQWRTDAPRSAGRCGRRRRRRRQRSGPGRVPGARGETTSQAKTGVRR